MGGRIDLNCDMGEGFGAWRMGTDEAIMPLITSVNIACGFHAGDPDTMRRTVGCAVRHGVAVGVHPGFPDLIGFGRRDMNVTPEEARNFVLYQIGALSAFVRAQGARLSHVKAHGALYNRAARDPQLASAIALAVKEYDPSLVFIGLANSELVRAGERLGLRVASEVFADRTYQPDGSLTSRRLPHAMVTEPREAAARVIRMVREGKVKTIDGQDCSVRADTVCIHGDTPGALEFAQAVRQELEGAGIEIGPL
ncbi:MAG: LamB/YcsF family protein [Acidobacteriia bacterium]|nr:LamB/YcsF family protein [Terriglobia bacterium]